MRLSRVEILRQSITRIVPALSAKNVRVMQQGNSAYVKYNRHNEPEVVVLPNLPDDASEELIIAVQGFLDHEVAHILFTDVSVGLQADKTAARSMFRMLEDVQIERSMRRAFQGSHRNLESTWGFVQDRIIKPAFDKYKESHASGNQMRELLFMAALRALDGQKVAVEFMADKWEFFEDWRKVVGEDLIEKIPEMRSTTDSFRLAVEMQNRVEEFKRQQEEEREKERKRKSAKDKKEDSGPKSPPTSGGKEVVKDPEEGNPERDPTESDSSEEGDDEGEDEGGTEFGTSGEPEDDEDEEEDGESEEGDEDEDEEGDSDEEGEESEEDDGDGDSGPSKSDEDEEDDSAGEDESKAAEETEEAEDKSSKLKLSDFEFDPSKSKDLESSMDDFIKAKFKEDLSSTKYYPFSRELDVVERFSATDSPELQREVAKLDEEVRKMVGLLQKKLERTIAARSLSRQVPGYNSGKVHGPSLHRVATGSDKLFSRKYETKTRDTAVQLVIDLSGSMSNCNKVRIAMETAYALSSVLDRMNIVHEVIGFTTCPLRWGEKYSRLASDCHAFETSTGHGVSRLEPLYMPILKDFSERLTIERKKAIVGVLREVRLYNNIDGESVETAARRLVARPENRKIMIVLSDGSPNGGYGDDRQLDRHLMKVVKSLPENGIDVFGIGILSEAVRRYYPLCDVVQSLQDLPAKVIHTMERMLFK